MIASNFQYGDHVVVLATGLRGKLVGKTETQADVVFDGVRTTVLRPLLRFDGDPPLHPDTGRPTVIYHKNQTWPRQPSLADYRLIVDDRGGWTILVNGEHYAAGGRPEIEDYWRPAMLPAHRAWLQALIHEQAGNPGQHSISPDDLGSASAGGLRL